MRTLLSAFAIPLTALGLLGGFFAIDVLDGWPYPSAVVLGSTAGGIFDPVQLLLLILLTLPLSIYLLTKDARLGTRLALLVVLALVVAAINELIYVRGCSEIGLTCHFGDKIVLRIVPAFLLASILDGLVFASRKKG